MLTPMYDGIGLNARDHSLILEAMHIRPKILAMNHNADPHNAVYRLTMQRRLKIYARQCMYCNTINHIPLRRSCHALSALRPIPRYSVLPLFVVSDSALLADGNNGHSCDHKAASYLHRRNCQL